jgi:uncharacterized protein Usg
MKKQDRKMIDKQLRGYRISTAEIIYRLPDHPNILQSFIWQHLDLAPHYPELKRFLRFWEEKIEGRLHSVKVGRTNLIKPAEFGHASAMLTLH